MVVDSHIDSDHKKLTSLKLKFNSIGPVVISFEETRWKKTEIKKYFDVVLEELKLQNIHSWKKHMVV